MSNDTITTLPVQHVTDHFSEGSLDFKRDKMSLGHTDFDVYTPADGRDQHMHFGTWKASLVGVTNIVTSGGETCTTINLVVDGRSIEIALWGVSIDTLAVAVEAAQHDQHDVD